MHPSQAGATNQPGVPCLFFLCPAAQLIGRSRHMGRGQALCSQGGCGRKPPSPARRREWRTTMVVHALHSKPREVPWHSVSRGEQCKLRTVASQTPGWWPCSAEQSYMAGAGGAFVSPPLQQNRGYSLPFNWCCWAPQTGGGGWGHAWGCLGVIGREGRGRSIGARQPKPSGQHRAPL